MFARSGDAWCAEMQDAAMSHSICRALASGFLAFLFGSPGFAQAVVQTGAGLTMRFSQSGGVDELSVGGTRLSLLDQPGGFFVVDVARSARNLLPPFSVRSRRQGWQITSPWRVASADGTRFAKVVSSGDGSGNLQSPRVAVKAGSPYLVAAQVRARSSATVFRPGIYLRQYDVQGRLVKVPTAKGEVGQLVIQVPLSAEEFSYVSTTFITQPETAKVDIYANIYKSAGQLEMKDVRLESLEMKPMWLDGRARRTDSGAVLTGSSPELQLELKATVTAHAGYIAVDGEVHDSSEIKADRLLQVGFSLPVDADRWTWWDDIEDSRRINRGLRYANYGGDFSLWRDQQVSVFPFASIDNDQVGILLGQRMDQPRLFRLYYDSSQGFCVDYSLGLAPDTLKFPSSASFHFVIGDHDPAWGMRAAAQRYYETFPDFFTVRAKRQGTYCYDIPADLSRPEDFGFCFDMGGFRRPQRRVLQGRGVYLFAHPMGTEAHLSWAEDHDWEMPTGRPTKEQIEDILLTDRPQYKQGPLWNSISHRYGNDTTFDDARVRTMNSAVYGRDGRICIYPYGKRLSFIATSADPELPSPNMAQGEWDFLIRRHATGARQAGTRLDGIDFDNISLFAGRVGANYRREHFEYVDHPLVYDIASRKLCIQTGISFQEFVKATADAMHARNNLCTGNFDSRLHTQTFFGHLLDKHGGEIHWNPPTNHLRAYRMLAYQKPVSHIIYSGVVAARGEETLMHRWLAFGEFPAIQELAYHSGSNFEKGRPLYKRFMPLMLRLAHAGWEPVTHARLDGVRQLLVERFGTWRGDNLYLTVHNDSDQPQNGDLVLDRTALGMPRQLRCVELLTGEIVERLESIPVRLPPRRTNVYHFTMQ